MDRLASEREHNLASLRQVGWRANFRVEPLRKGAERFGQRRSPWPVARALSHALTIERAAQTALR